MNNADKHPGERKGNETDWNVGKKGEAGVFKGEKKTVERDFIDKGKPEGREGGKKGSGFVFRSG